MSAHRNPSAKSTSAVRDSHNGEQGSRAYSMTTTLWLAPLFYPRGAARVLVADQILSSACLVAQENQKVKATSGLDTRRRELLQQKRVMPRLKKRADPDDRDFTDRGLTYINRGQRTTSLRRRHVRRGSSDDDAFSNPYHRDRSVVHRRRWSMWRDPVRTLRSFDDEVVRQTPTRADCDAQPQHPKRDNARAHASALSQLRRFL